MRDDEYIILDNQLRRVGLLSNRVRAGTPFWGDTIDQSIAEDDSAFAWEDLKDTFNTINLAANKKTYDHTITGITVPSNAPDAQHLKPGNHLLYYDAENERYYVMRLMNIDESSKETDRSFSFDAQNLCEWKLTRTIPTAFSSDAVNAQTAFTNLLAKSGWRLQYNSRSTLTLKETYDGSSSAQSYLQQLAADYDLDVDCYVQLDAAGNVVDQLVEVTDHLGNTQRKRLDYRNDLVGVDRKLVDDALVTKLYVLGNDGATIEDANNGIAFLTDPNANAKYNHDIKGRGSTWLEGTITSETIKNSAGLLAWGKQQLSMYNHPRYNYTVQIRADIAGGIGDDFRVVDFDLTPAMIVDARVIKVSKSKSDPAVHELTLGEYATITPKKVSGNVDLDQLKKDVAKAHADALSASQTATTAQSTASDAAQRATVADTNAQTANTAATNAQATATQAQTTATSANETATTASQDAAKATETATTAQATATAANETAVKATTAVGTISKTYFADDVYFQPNQPATSDDGALWFKVTGTTQYLNYHDDSQNGGTGSTTKTVTVQVANDGKKVTATGKFTWSGQHPIKQSPSMAAATRAYTYSGLSATYAGKVIASGILWCYYTAYNGGTAYVPIKDLSSGTRYGTDSNASSDPAAYHNETQTITVPGTTGNAVNDSQITLTVENVDDVQQYLGDHWSSIPFQKQLIGANISGASIDAPLISLGDGGVVWSSYSITQDPRFYQPIAAQGTVAMAQGELVVSGQTQYYDLTTNTWVNYQPDGTTSDGTNYTTTIINAGGIKNEMQDSARNNLVGRTYMNGLKISLGDADGHDVFTVNRQGLNHTVSLTAPDLYATNRLHTTLIQPDGANDALKLESGTGDSRVQSQSIYNVTNSHGANVYITATGSLTRSASATKYKQDIHDMYDLDTLSAALLKAKPKYWFDKPSIQNIVAAHSKGHQPSLDATTAEQPGLIAEDLKALGLDKFLFYSADGELEGVDYAKLWVLLIPALNQLRHELHALKEVTAHD